MEKGLRVFFGILVTLMIFQGFCIYAAGYREQAEVISFAHKKHFLQIDLFLPQGGTVTNLDSYLEEIVNLESYFDHLLHIEKGMLLEPSPELTFPIGTVYLVHEDEEVIESDYDTLLKMTALLVQ